MPRKIGKICCPTACRKRLAKRLPRDLTGKTGGEAAPRPDGKDLQRSGPRSLAGKAAAEDAGQSAERLVPRLAGCIRPLVIGHAEGRHGDGDGKKSGRGRKEA